VFAITNHPGPEMSKPATSTDMYLLRVDCRKRDQQKAAVQRLSAAWDAKAAAGPMNAGYPDITVDWMDLRALLDLVSEMEKESA
jgi:hypothetical protein